MNYIEDNNLDNIDKYNIDLIKGFTLEDYFSCKETKNIVKNEWYNKIHNDLEDDLRYLFNDYYNTLSVNKYNTLYKLTEEHFDDLFDIIKFHVRKEYSTEIFELYPHFADPLIYKVNSKKFNSNNLSKNKYFKINK
jgi:hypothetical protein